MFHNFCYRFLWKKSGLGYSGHPEEGDPDEPENPDEKSEKRESVFRQLVGEVSDILKSSLLHFSSFNE
jgi:hypothetical protein